MALSKKYYRMIAKVISESGLSEEGKKDITYRLQEEFQRDNPRFDPTRWQKAALARMSA
jgi:hypothetical protein